MLFRSNFEGSFHNDAFVYEFRDVASCDQRRRISGCTNFHANRRYLKIPSKSLLTSQLLNSLRLCDWVYNFTHTHMYTHYDVIIIQNITRLLRVSVCFYGFLRVFAGFYGFLRVFAGFYGFLRVFAGFYGFLRGVREVQRVFVPFFRASTSGGALRSKLYASDLLKAHLTKKVLPQFLSVISSPTLKIVQ